MSLVHPMDKSHLVSRFMTAQGGGSAAEDEVTDFVLLYVGAIPNSHLQVRENICNVIVRFCEACLERRSAHPHSCVLCASTSASLNTS